ncbi:DUF1254 domain-containing protein [Stenotrophomonas indicatrix]|uniref:DUF1254 domain-containing protein n=1 Tax=Stenotrophomonas indicatrix TaxID=2045451 RepID=UPI001FAF5E5D|nr:DUF1254 domain-containing protein [Stenotrophomonas indicatrix]
MKKSGLGKISHIRAAPSIEGQSVVRMNRDTLYSSGVFDLDAGPLTIVLPDPGSRFMSMQVISEDHYTTEVVYAPGTYTYDRARVGTRYVYPIIRTLVSAEDAADVKAANRLQDAVSVRQKARGTFEIPEWDEQSRTKVRQALKALAAQGTGDRMFGSKAEVDPIDFLVGAAVGWGGNPPSAAMYVGVQPVSNDGTAVHELIVKDVPVDGFWSISVYNESGFFEKNKADVYSLNNFTAKKSSDGSYRIQFGGCETKADNCIPIMKGWNYTVRLYRPRKELLSGAWKFPEARPVSK